MNIGLQTWFPYHIQICLNGREWLRRCLEQRDIDFWLRAIKAHVDCTDGRIGRLENIIVNSQAERITYLVVMEHNITSTLRLIPGSFSHGPAHQKR
jgi:hypothetical protein